MDIKKLLKNLGIALVSIAVVLGAVIHVGPIFGTFVLGIILLFISSIKNDD